MPPDASRFRRWLIGKLKVSRWSNATDTPLSELARQLGVQEDVLRAAQEDLDAERQAAGLPVAKLGRPTQAESGQCDHVQLKQWLPRELYEEWTAVAASKGLARATLFRSAVHAFLMQTRPPRHAPTSNWMVGGQVVHVPNQSPYALAVRVSLGAKEGLTRVALGLGCSEYALVRSIIMDTLTGQLRKIVILTSHTQMWQDPERYPGVQRWTSTS